MSFEDYLLIGLYAITIVAIIITFIIMVANWRLERDIAKLQRYRGEEMRNHKWPKQFRKP